MKPTIKLSVFAVMVLLLSCTQLDNPESGPVAGGTMIQKQLAVSNGEWVPDARSSFVPGQGITLSGDEHLAVYYNAYDASAGTQFATGVQKCVEAVPSSNGEYTFSHDALAGAEAYNYFCVMPYRQLQTTGTHEGVAKAVYNLRAVQYPSAVTYDPVFDYLVGKPAETVEQSGTVEVTAFKRIVAPFRLTVSDPSGLLGGETARAVTIDFPGGDKVAGKFYLDFYGDYEAAGISAKYNAYSGTALTAVYPDGLEPVSGGYEVWLVSLPAIFQADQKVTVTVTGETKTVSCSAVLPSDVELMADRFNSLSFGLSETKDGYESSQSLHFDFSELTTVPSALSASDGEDYAFVNDGCGAYGLSKVPVTSGLKIKTANTLTLPQITGKAIKKVRLYTHEESYDSSSSQASFAISCDDASASALYYPRGEGFPQGYVDLEFVQAQSGPVNLNVSYSDGGTHNAIISSLSLYLSEEEQGGGGSGEEPDMNDYYAAYLNGETLTFGDLSINKDTYDAESIAATDLTYDMMSAGGVYFIESSDEYVTLTGANSTYSVANSAELILIGRYADAQPKIKAKELRANVHDFSMINIDFQTLSTNQMVCKSSDVATSSGLKFIDCKISSAGSLKYILRDYQGGSAPYAKVLFDNCILDISGLTVAMYYANPSSVSGSQSLEITDCVIYSGATLTAPYLNDCK